MGSEPLVSICIPTYNRADFLDKAIRSALQQTYRNIEIIVIDNASTDNTDEILSRFNDLRLKYIKNTENFGLFGNFNRCIEQARGEYIHILHSDDTIEPTFTECCMKFIQDHPSVRITTTSARIVTGDSERDISFSDKDLVIKAPEGLKYLFCYRNFIVCPSVMVHRDVYRDVGNYSLEYPYSSDLYQWFRILRGYDIGYVSRAVLNYRQGAHSESYRLLFTSPTGYLDILKILVRIMQEIGGDRPRFNDDLTCFVQKFIKDCLYGGFVRGAVMEGFRPAIFIGIAISAWSLIRPGSWRDTVSKYSFLFLIIAAGVLMSAGPVRRFISRRIAGDSMRY